MSCNTKLGTFCAEHEDWQELLSQEPYNLVINFDGLLVMFNYNQLSSDFSNPIVREARGIIFELGEWDAPVCHAFDKFGNLGEDYVPNIDWSTITVSEKIDGSIMKLWFWNGKWRVSTNGTICAAKAPIDDIRRNNFLQVFWEGVRKHFVGRHRGYDDAVKGWLNTLDIGYTYIFELVSPFNRVVVPYDEPDVYFLGARHNVSNNEWGCDEESAKVLGVDMFPRPKLFPMTTAKEVQEAANELSWNNEGYVCYDINFNRCKIKSPNYVLAHFSRNNNVITRKHLINIILKGEGDEFLTYAEDYKDVFFEVKSLMKSYVDSIGGIGEFARGLRKLDRKRAAEIIGCFDKIARPIMFANYERDVSGEDWVKDWDVYKWDRILDQYQKFKER